MDLSVFLFMSLLGIGVILFAVLKGKQESVPHLVDKDLEESLQAFMDEFEKENQYLLQTIKQLETKLQRETEENREKLEELEAKVEFLSTQGRETKRSVKDSEPTPAIVFNEHYSRIVTMWNEGRTPEQIAKQTGIGMGEIQMILSLVKQGNTV
ncbi:DUF6115 domain-containing protein [Effusibacillus dendaii]|uniref:DUF2802 domain-containing protein n=1 Tax=Effusibacillus dendaii TaxID=2743772 RepID=A0A7I8D9U2_9BACL|nr:hypothetical protein [Effusibacillus dendaii]BCJ85290.1 hypothetical protein skT53_02750 [Effusibacillus dendaii]